MNHLAQLAVNAQGFVFDPTSGESFTVNQTGLMILNGLRDNKTPERIVHELASTYDVPIEQVEKDMSDFCSHLKMYNLMEDA